MVSIAECRLRTLMNKAKLCFIAALATLQIPHQANSQINTVSGPIAVVELKDKWYFINTKGENVFDREFEGAGTFSEGLAPVRVLGKWGYIDETGKTVIPPQFDAAAG